MTGAFVTMDMPSIDPNKRKRGRPKGSKNSTTSTRKKSKATGPKRGRGRPKGSKTSTTTSNKQKISYDPKRRKVEYALNFDSRITEGERETGNQKIADSVLMRFDAVRRRFCQLGIKHHLLTTALSNCMKLGMMTNMKRRIGPVPGVNVGDIFFYWREMNLVGLHLPNVQGIDYLTKKDGAALPLATSVATSEQIAGETDEIETLVYTGQGGKKDQVLKTGNLALERSITEVNDVRVIRCQEDPNKKDQKIYFYDGLYSVTSFWTKRVSGFDVFKFKMVRRPGQPSGYATWKKVEQWRKHGFDSSVNGFIKHDLSDGEEALPISVVNEVDENDKTMPGHFEYITSQHLSTLQLINTDPQPLGCQNCRGHACPKDSDCNCLKRNNGKLPYFNNILVCRTSMVYECGDRCLCVCDCKMRVVQNGLKLRVQVFKTEKCGWGLRSWEPIRAGTFICEFAGMSMRKEEVEVDDEYLFDTSRFYNQFSWNYEPELVDEDFREQVSEVYNLPNQVLISGKECGNASRFMNHSCSPNIFWQPIMAEAEAGSYIRIGFFAMKNIPPLTELRYDYGTSFVSEEGEEDGVPKFKGRKICLCGSMECRGYFG